MVYANAGKERHRCVVVRLSGRREAGKWGSASPSFHFHLLTNLRGMRGAREKRKEAPSRVARALYPFSLPLSQERIREMEQKISRRFVFPSYSAKRGMV